MKTQPDVSGSSMKLFGPLDHFDYAVLDRECRCSICHEYRMTLDTYQGVVHAIVGHVEGCGCDMCSREYKARSVHIAATSRRDLYCESSFHARVEPDLGIEYMRWLTKQIQLGFQGRTVGWWERKAHQMPMRSWFNKFHSYQQACSAMVSGAAA